MIISKLDDATDVSESQLQELEKAARCKLPPDYRSFLLSNNGGKPSPSHFNVAQLDDEVIVDIFYGIGVEEELDIVFWLEELDDDLPSKFLPIATDPGGAVCLLNCGSKKKPAGVFF